MRPGQHPKKARGLTLDTDTFAHWRRELTLVLVQLAASTDALRSLAADANPGKVIAAAHRVSTHHTRALTALVILADQDDASTYVREVYAGLLDRVIGPVVRGQESATDAVDRLAIRR